MEGALDEGVVWRKEKNAYHGRSTYMSRTF